MKGKTKKENKTKEIRERREREKETRRDFMCER